MQHIDIKNVLSLFNGMSGARMALDVAGFNVKNYYSSEVDKFANKLTNNLYPSTINLGDVTSWRDWDIEQPDLIIFGSPCQGFSFVGKQLNFQDPRSSLFFEAHAIVNNYKPKFFIMENVKMKAEFSEIISNLLGVEPILINSSLLSAQNRNRLYWVGRLNSNGTYSKVNVEQPKDKCLYLKDIIEDGDVDRDKAHCLDANYFKGGNLKSYFEKHRRQLVFSNDGINRSIHCGAIRGRYDSSGKIKQALEIRKDEKTNTITTVQKDNVIVDLDATNYSERSKSQIKKNSKRRNQKAVSMCENSNNTGSGVNILYDDNNLTYRKLTPRECLRLQTVPRHIIEEMLSCGISNTQLYRMAGNGFTIDVIAHLLRRLGG